MIITPNDIIYLPFFLLLNAKVKDNFRPKGCPENGKNRYRTYLVI